MINSFLLHAMSHKRVNRWMTKLVGPYVTIFTLHRPNPADGYFQGINESLLEQCLEFAVNQGYQFLSIDELVARAASEQVLDRPTLCFTLDDGYADQVTRLVPTLLKYRAKPTMFVITDFIDKQDWPWDAKIAYITWHTKITAITLMANGNPLKIDCSSLGARIATRRMLSRYAKSLNKQSLDAFIQELQAICAVKLPVNVPQEYEPVSWDTLRHYEQQGLRVGAHSRSHYVLSALTDEEIVQELGHSKMRVESELKNPSNVFCYPSGTAKDFSSNHPQLVEQAGFSSAITTISKPTNLSAIRDNLFQINRIGFPESLERFIRYSSWLEVVRNKFTR